MPKFRKKPVAIDAVQITEEWFHDDPPSRFDMRGCKPNRAKWVVEVWTLEGVMTGNVGDWIITGVNGEKYPCKPDIFEKTYEPV